MKKRWIHVALSVGCLLASTAVFGWAGEIPTVSGKELGFDDQKLTEVDKFMTRQVDDKKIAGGIIVVARNGKVGFFNVYGLKDVETHKAMERDTIFRLFSMSKSVTTAAALTLFDAGKIGLEDPVSKYIPSFGDLKVATSEGLRPANRPMTIKDLMLHTSGLTYGAGPDAVKEAYSRLKPMEASDLDQMATRLSQCPLAFDPGTDWGYSVSIDVLGRVIEIASGQSLDAYLKKTIFEPLEMTDTGFELPPEKLQRLATNYRRSPSGLVVIPNSPSLQNGRQTKLNSGGGGLLGTARDYLRFLMMISNGGELDGKRILQPETVKLMTTNQLPEKAFPIHFGSEIRHGTGFSLGFSVRTADTSWDPAGHVGEYGWGGAASTHYWVSPADKTIVITLEQIMPYQWDTEFGVKPLIYNALKK